jgi:hypothetical protein
MMLPVVVAVVTLLTLEVLVVVPLSLSLLPGPALSPFQRDRFLTTDTARPALRVVVAKALLLLRALPCRAALSATASTKGHHGV